MTDNSPSLKLTLLFVATLTIMAGTTVAPSLPAIEQSFLSTPNVEIMSRMVLTLPSVFVALCAPVAGVLADRFGRKRLLLGAILLYSLSGMSGLFADSLAGLLVGRAFLGFAIGGIMTIGTALVGDYFEGPARERYLGLQQAFTQLGGVVFVVAGGLLADVHWRAPFAVYAVALLILPAALLFLREPARNNSHVKNGGEQAFAVNWFLVAVLALAAFLVNALFYTIPSQLPFFLRELGLFSGSVAGYAIGIFNLAGALMALNFGRLGGADWRDRYSGGRAGVDGNGFCAACRGRRVGFHAFGACGGGPWPRCCDAGYHVHDDHACAAAVARAYCRRRYGIDVSRAFHIAAGKPALDRPVRFCRDLSRYFHGVHRHGRSCRHGFHNSAMGGGAKATVFCPGWMTRSL
ncbi:MFS transporter [Rhizobium sp. AN88]|uniref:MFS transporter n=1 Tax=Rhizobium sp. AN88 TaxID=3035215 RepID=UPI002B25DC95|nr:MFS transporter [Rhizobium sp. AN88]